MSKLRVAMLAPAWLKVPASGYGGIESMIDNLCRGLREQDVYVELFTVKGSETPASRYHWLYTEEQFEHVNHLLYDAAAIPAAHLLSSIESIRRNGRFDIIHDHNVLMGPAMMRDQLDLPPVLHTLHGPFSNEKRVEEGYIDTTLFYSELGKSKKLYFNGISKSQLNEAPWRMRPRVVGAIHHGIDPSAHKFYPEKDNYFVNVGRVAEEKGIGLAAEICADIGAEFKIAGVIAGLTSPRAVAQALETTSSLDASPDFAYFRDKVRPYLRSGKIEYVGGVFGEAKDDLIGRAKAFLMPIQWEEPFGVAVIDALVCGTPVVAMRRGSMPEIIEHGINGFLADTPEEFRHYMTRVGEIDPAACRQSVERRFSYQTMTRQYVAMYRKIVARHASRPRLAPQRLVSQANLAIYEAMSPQTSRRKARPLK